MADIDTTTETEYLYAKRSTCYDGCWSYSETRGIYYAGREPGHQCYGIAEYPITKKTPKRIYFTGGAGCTQMERERTYFVDRAIIEAHRGIYHSTLRELLYLKRPNLTMRAEPKTVSQLRQEMADAHPDRGGDRDSFQVARARFLAAKARPS